MELDSILTSASEVLGEGEDFLWAVTARGEWAWDTLFSFE